MIHQLEDPWIPPDTTITIMVIPHADEVRYYPLVQLFIVAIFIIVTIFSLHHRNRSYKTRYGPVWQKKLLTSWELRFRPSKVGWKC